MQAFILLILDDRGDVVVPRGASEVVSPPDLGEAPIVSLLERARGAEADVVVARRRVEASPGWEEALCAEAYADSTTATASALPVTRDDAGDSHSPLAATIERPLWSLAWIRRDALELAVALMPSHPASFETTNVLDELLVRPGLVHRLAPAWVVAADSDVAGGRRSLLPTSQARRALASLRPAGEPVDVEIDGDAMSFPLTGTQVHTLRLVEALARREDVRVSLRLPAQLHPSSSEEVERLPEAVTLHTRRGRSQADVFHRPYQIFFPESLPDVTSVGTKIVITLQDLIGARTPTYFPDRRRWHATLALTELSTVLADHVVFFSEHARNQALEDTSLARSRTSVIPLGTEHLDAFRDRPDLDEPPGANLRDPYLLVLGNAYAHKNRLYALRLFEELSDAHRFDGTLVYAGGAPEYGSSVPDERAYLARRPELATRVHDLGEVTEPQKRWLYRHAALVLYPTLYEGFGLIPFEAAALGTPCVYARRSSLGEFLPVEGALLDTWDVRAAAAGVNRVVSDATAAASIVTAIRSAAAKLTWQQTAAGYARVYHDVLARPQGLATALNSQFVVAPLEATAAGSDEQRLLRVYRQSGALQRLGGTVLSAGAALRHKLRTSRD